MLREIVEASDFAAACSGFSKTISGGGRHQMRARLHAKTAPAAMPEMSSWAESPRELAIASDEIHVWRARLDCEAPILRQFEATLAADEQDRARRFHFERDRDSYIATRGLLRELLARYVGRAPAKIEFEYSALGKPSLRATHSDEPIRFNVSHSHGMALFAFAIDRSVGVDVELLRPDFGGMEIAERFFSRQEVEELRSLPGSLQGEGFFLCWTRKEAYVKARGEGLHIPLDSFHVSLTPGQPEKLSSADSARWSLRSLRPDPKYAGALVAEAGEWHLRLLDWSANEVLT
jgi:4'-phosphopantetheinyl transferase